MDLLTAIQKWGGGGVVGLAIYCFLKFREQRSSDTRGERADDRDDRKAELDGFEKLAATLSTQLDKAIARCTDLQRENDAKDADIEELRTHLADLRQDKLQLESKVNGYSWMESGQGITPESLRRLAAQLEARSAEKS